MAEYIDKNKLIRDLIDNRSFYPAIVKNAIENAPTADVVPRSEVEKAKQEVVREIFEEFENKIAEEDNIFEKCASRIVGSDYCNGRSEIIGFVLNLIAELKKKYIGE